MGSIRLQGAKTAHFCSMNTRLSGSARVDSRRLLPLGDVRGPTNFVKITKDCLQIRCGAKYHGSGLAVKKEGNKKFATSSGRAAVYPKPFLKWLFK